MHFIKIFTILLLGLFIISCDSKPKVIESETESPSPGDMSLLKEMGGTSDSNKGPDVHKVKVEEVLNTDKYTYLRVTEAGDSRWIAIAKRDVEIGDTYYYSDGLLKQNFYSQEFNRVFETIYLVSKIWKQPDGSNGNMTMEEAHSGLKTGVPDLEVGKINRAEGAVKISELYANRSQYNGKLVKVTGKCVKVNPMIMNRNWIHLQDGSDEALDLTVTTTENILLGAVVTVEGTIALNKDFGAGYRYDLIMEGAILK